MTHRVLDKILTDALERVVQREYEMLAEPGGRRRRKPRPLEPNALNAAANAACVLIDLAAQREAHEEVRRVRAELDRMHAMVADLLEHRALSV